MPSSANGNAYKHTSSYEVYQVYLGRLCCFHYSDINKFALLDNTCSICSTSIYAFSFPREFGCLVIRFAVVILVKHCYAFSLKSKLTRSKIFVLVFYQQLVSTEERIYHANVYIIMNYTPLEEIVDFGNVKYVRSVEIPNQRLHMNLLVYYT